MINQKIFSYLSYQEHIKLSKYEFLRPYIYLHHDLELNHDYLCFQCKNILTPIMRNYLEEHYGGEDEYLEQLFIYEGDFTVQTEDEKDDLINDSIKDYLGKFYQLALYEILFEERSFHLISPHSKCHLHSKYLLPFLEKIEKRCLQKYIQKIENL
jgi:hypothetical protein